MYSSIHPSIVLPEWKCKRKGGEHVFIIHISTLHIVNKYMLFNHVVFIIQWYRNWEHCGIYMYCGICMSMCGTENMRTRIKHDRINEWKSMWPCSLHLFRYINQSNFCDTIPPPYCRSWSAFTYIYTFIHAFVSFIYTHRHTHMYAYPCALSLVH